MARIDYRPASAGRVAKVRCPGGSCPRKSVENPSQEIQEALLLLEGFGDRFVFPDDLDEDADEECNAGKE